MALKKVFSDNEVTEVLTAAGDSKIKTQLQATTVRVVKDQGAFGCPWFWVRNGRGQAEPFFGSDRFHYMWDFLEIPHGDLALKANL